MKEMEKLEKRMKELQEEQNRLIAWVNQYDSERQRVIARIQSNSGAIKELSAFISVTEEKNVESLAGEKKKEEKKSKK